MPVIRLSGSGSGIHTGSTGCLLSGSGQLAKLVLQSIRSRLDLPIVVTLEGFFNVCNERLDLRLGFSRELVTKFLELLFHGVHRVISRITDLDTLCLFLVSIGILLGFLLGLFDFVIAEAG